MIAAEKAQEESTIDRRLNNKAPNLIANQLLFVWAKQNYSFWDRLRSNSNFVSLKVCAL